MHSPGGLIALRDFLYRSPWTACRPQKKDITLKIAFIKKQNDYICYKIEKKLFIFVRVAKKERR